MTCITRSGDRWRAIGRIDRSLACLFAVLTPLVLLGAFSLRITNATFTEVTHNTGNSFTADTLQPPVKVAAMGGADVMLEWKTTTSTYATGHRIFRSTSSGGPYVQIAEVSPRTVTTHTDDPPAGTYYYIVRSYTPYWESPDSIEVSAVVIGVKTQVSGSTTAGRTPD